MLIETITTTVRAEHGVSLADLSKWSVPLWAFPGVTVPAFETRLGGFLWREVPQLF